LNWITCR